MEIFSALQLQQLGVSGTIIAVLIWMIILSRRDNLAIVKELTRVRALYEKVQEIRIAETKDCMKEANSTLVVLNSALELTKEIRHESTKSSG